MSIAHKALALIAALALPIGMAAARPAGPVAAASKPAPGAPRLLVAIAIDQFSADLFAQYRAHFTGGLARLATGAVFPAGFQSHSATETCPGHSTILTGMRPAHTGIIANTWFDQSVARANKQVYCAEDETMTALTSGDYVASPVHLLVPTLGERIKAVWPTSRTVAVSGKDRAVLMMGGKTLDEGYWWKGKAFTTLDWKAMTPSVEAQNAEVTATLATGAPGYALPDYCAPYDRAVTAGTVTVGTGRFVLAAGDATAFRVSPRIDAAVVALATRLVDADKLGQGPTPDVLAISLSATDYVGHGYGTEGAEMCIQLHQLDAALGDLFAALDARGIDYGVVLTADHGGYDMPERLRAEADPAAARADAALGSAALSARIGAKLALEPKGLFMSEGPAGDFWVRRDLTADQKTAAIAAARDDLLAQPQVASVFAAADIAATPMPSGSPDTWTLIQRARASFYQPRSGDFYVVLRRGIMAMPLPAVGYVATHGSAWDYDRRVPILFWRKGMTGFEQPHPVETVDIAPTLAAWIGLPLPAGTFDGRCLDLDAGPGTTCGVKP